MDPISGCFYLGTLSQPKSIGNSSWMDLQALKCSLNIKLPQIFFEQAIRNNAQWSTKHHEWRWVEHYKGLCGCHH